MSAPTWSLRIGWDMAGHTRNWPISEPSSQLAARRAVIGCQPRRSSRFVETKAVRWTQWLKGLILSTYYVSSLAPPFDILVSTFTLKNNRKSAQVRNCYWKTLNHGYSLRYIFSYCNCFKNSMVTVNSMVTEDVFKMECACGSVSVQPSMPI